MEKLVLIPSRTRSALLTLGLLGTVALTPIVTAAAADGQAADVRPSAVKDQATKGTVVSGPVGTRSVTDVILFSYNTGSTSGDRCWDHFAPGAPGGLPFAQTYRNCNGRGVNVHMGSYNGGVFTEDVGCFYVPDGWTAVVLRSGADRDGVYGTWGC
jgi:hypothetical protein